MASTVYVDVSILLLEYDCFSFQHDSFQHVTRNFLDWLQDDKTVVILECIYHIMASLGSFTVDF